MASFTSVRARSENPVVIDALVVLAQMLHHLIDISTTFTIDNFLSSLNQTSLFKLWAGASLPGLTADIAELGSAQASGTRLT